jgi:hypothetical protein
VVPVSETTSLASILRNFTPGSNRHDKQRASTREKLGVGEWDAWLYLLTSYCMYTVYVVVSVTVINTVSLVLNAHHDQQVNHAQSQHRAVVSTLSLSGFTRIAG